MSRACACRNGFAWVWLVLLILIVMASGALAASVDVRKVLDTTTLGDPFVYDVNPEGAVLVLTRDNVYDAGAGEFLFGVPLKNPGWLAFAGGKLQLLANGSLFVVDGGMPRKLIEVPLKNRLFASDAERTFISGITTAGKPVLYIYKDGLGHKPLVELAAPIDAMTLTRGELYFSVGPRIYALREGGPARLFAYFPAFPYITSMAVDDRHPVLYFSDGESVYAVRGQDFVVVRRGLGGMLRYRDGNLYVLSWRERALFRMSGLSEAFSSAGTLAPLKDPCKAPVISLYCEAEEKRALLKSLAAVGRSMASGDAVGRKELDVYAAGQQKELGRIMTRLKQEAAAGTEAVMWGGDLEPKTIRAKTVITTAGKGVGVTLWDGSGICVGPDSKLSLNACGPSRECRQTLEKGLLYVESYKPPVEGMLAAKAREFVVETAALSLRFGLARLAVYVSGDKTAIVVMEGRVKAVTAGGYSVFVASGETLEVRRGERPGVPVSAKMERVKKWWEDIR